MEVEDGCVGRTSLQGGRRMKLFWRWMIGLAILLLVAGLGLFIAAHFYLSSHNVAGQVSTRLQAMLGAPCKSIPPTWAMTGDSSLHGLRVFEAGGSRAAGTLRHGGPRLRRRFRPRLARRQNADGGNADRRGHCPAFRRRRPSPYAHAQAANRRRADAARPHRRRQTHAQPRRPATDGDFTASKPISSSAGADLKATGAYHRSFLGRLDARRRLCERIGRRRADAGR